MYRFILNIILALSLIGNVISAKENMDVSKASTTNSCKENLYEVCIDKKNMSDVQLLTLSEINISKHEISIIEKKVEKLCQVLKSKKAELSEVGFVTFTFNYVKKQYLINYKADAEFSELFKTNTYDCVTGTALFALLFERFEIKYQILESYSHVCIKVQNDSMNILLESTLKDGIYTDGKKIYEMVHKFHSERRDLVVKVFNASYKPLNSNYYSSKIDLTQLIGILYFNKAAQNLVEKKYEQSIYFAKFANALYPSTRTQGFLVYSMDLLLKDDSVDYKTKVTYYKKYKYLIGESLLVLKQ